MGDLDTLLNEAADYIERLLDERPDAADDLAMLRKNGQEPNVFRTLGPQIGLLIRFQDVPK